MTIPTTDSTTNSSQSANARTTLSDVLINPHPAPPPSSQSSSSTTTDPFQIKAFHESLPSFNKTSLHNLSDIAGNLGIAQCLVKAESSRLGLPAFKVLGASWGVFRALCKHYQLPPDPTVVTLEKLREHVKACRQPDYVGVGKGSITLFAATDGNHGRAVARMARLWLLSDQACTKLDVGQELTKDEVSAYIYVPGGMYETTRQLIRSEGAKVVVVDGNYDVAVQRCWEASQKMTKESGGVSTGIMVQDNAFSYKTENGKEEIYKGIPRWIVQGYSTLLAEVDEQFQRISHTGRMITHVITPIGVGSLGHAVVNWAKSKDPEVKVIAVEPQRAACLHESLRTGKNLTIETEDTIMSGMCCGTVSPISWETLRSGVDVSVTIGECEAHEAVMELRRNKVEAGPCGAAGLAGLHKCIAKHEVKRVLGLGSNSIVVVLSTEGLREYPMPERGT